MEPADSIGRIGFRKWYERQLIEGHAWFITCFLCMIAIAAVLEELSFRGPLARLLAYGAVVFASGVVGIYAFLRYQRLMTMAERLGDLATCTQCGTYGRFAMVSAHAARCRKCAHEWRLID
ncbi:MAG: hypothetical protein EPO27_03950 [Betaproteobacteria bacterium]|nr:MAG: hypothetical protein EPO27_03950 [Betaproteobacteria bacterium]